VVSEALVKAMQPGRVVVDLSIDQGGCVETSRPTTHHEPVFVEHDVLHYCVGNVPGAVPHTSTYALTHATLPCVEAIAGAGLLDVLRSDDALRRGVNVFRGAITNEGVAEAHGVEHQELAELL
jgi:alanine dehydrogenase